MSTLRTCLERLVPRWAHVYLGSCVIILATAWAFQYGFGYAPCELCLYQRYPYMVVAALAVFVLAFPSLNSSRIALGFLGVIVLVMCLEAAIALYHVGIEQAWWQGSGSCVASFNSSMSEEEIRNVILNSAPVRCDVPAWTLLGISMAGYNFLLASLLVMFGLYALRRLRSA